MPNPENIEKHKWQKGQPPANPAGRPPGKSIKSILNDLLDKRATQKLKNLADVKELSEGMAEELTNRDILALRLYSKAVAKSDLKAIEQILDRTEGKPKQQMDVTSDGKAIKAPVINVISTDDSES